MLKTKIRHLKHLLKFDYDEKKEDNKRDSDYALDILNINKDEFFLISRQETALLIGNNFHENDIYKLIQVFKTNQFIIIYLDCYFLKAGFDSDFGQLLFDGKKSFEDCNAILIDKKQIQAD